VRLLCERAAEKEIAFAGGRSDIPHLLRLFPDVAPSNQQCLWTCHLPLRVWSVVVMF
jgi:hypothetical protein